MNKLQKRNLHNKMLFERRVQKINTLVNANDSYAKTIHASVMNRFSYTNKKGEIKYSKGGVKKFDKAIKSLNTKKVKKQTPIQQARKILGMNAWKEFKKNLNDNRYKFKETINDLNKNQDFATIVRNFTNPNAIFYYENKKLIIAYNKSRKDNGDNHKKTIRLGNELNEKWFKFQTDKEDMIAQQAAKIVGI